MKGFVSATKHPYAYTCFWYFVGCSLGHVLGSAVLFYNFIDPQVYMAVASTWMIVATLIALTWGEK